MAADRSFWDALDRLLEIHPVVIDRSKGSSHPRYSEARYPLNCGYLSGARSADGRGLEVWIGSLQPPRITGLALTMDLHEQDAELILMLGCTLDEMRVAKAFMDQGETHAMLIIRGADGMDWLRQRRSVRRFTAQPVSLDVLKRILEAASWAPSPHNSQPWRFVVLRSAQSRHDLTASLGLEFLKDLLASGVKPEDARAQVERSARRIQEAPVAIVLCLDESVLGLQNLESRQVGERLMAVQSVAMAGQNLLLAAHCSGLGGVWLCAPLFAPQAVRRALDLPQSWQPQGMVLLGYPAALPSPRERQPIDSLTSYR